MRNSSVYKIKCKDNTINEIYIGSSSNFKKRCSDHKYFCKTNTESNRAYNTPVYKFIRDHNGIDNWDFVVLEEICCDSTQLLARERHWFDICKTSHTLLNSNVPNRDRKEYRALKKKFYCDICDCKVLIDNKARHLKSTKHLIRLIFQKIVNNSY